MDAVWRRNCRKNGTVHDNVQTHDHDMKNICSTYDEHMETETEAETETGTETINDTDTIPNTNFASARIPPGSRIWPPVLIPFRKPVPEN